MNYIMLLRLNMLLFWLLMTYCAVAFDFKCPHSSQRRFRAVIICHKLSMYQCLFDIINKTYTETCTQTADYVAPGQKYVISGGRRSYNCSIDRYQPFKFWSNETHECYYKKSTCNELGQLKLTSLKDDNTCGCDNIHGYRFLIDPHHLSYCEPSKEDCSCYKPQCPESSFMSSSNNCIHWEKVDDLRPSQDVTTRITFFTTYVSITNIDRTAKSRDPSLKAALSSIIMFTKVSVTIVIVAIVVEFVCKEKNEENNVEGESQFLRKISGNWKGLKEELNASPIIRSFVQNKFITKKESKRYADMSLPEQNTFILLYIVDNCKDLNKLQIFQRLLKEQGTKIQNILSRPIPIKRLPKRDEKICMRALDEARRYLNHIEPRDFLDDFVENFIFSTADFDDVIKLKDSKSYMIDCFLNKIKKTLQNGSIDCFLKLLQEMKSIELYDRLRENLPEAIVLKPKADYQTTSLRKSEMKDMKNHSIKLAVLNPKNKEHFSTLFFKRVKNCSVWFIKELALYPKSLESTVDCNIQLFPLINDVWGAVEESIMTGGFLNLMEICFCEKEIMRFLTPPNDGIEVSLIIEKCDINNVRTVSDVPPSQDCDSYLMNVNRTFLAKEIQTSQLSELLDVVTKVQLLKYTSSKSSRDNDVEKFLDLVAEKKLFQAFLKILHEKQFNYILNRLNESIKAFSRRHLISRNIIKNIVDLIDLGLRLGLEEFRQIFIERKVFTDDWFDQIVTENSDSEEQAMISFLIKIIQTETTAAFNFVDALYVLGHYSLAERLLSEQTESKEEWGDSNIEISQILDKEGVLVHAHFQVCLTS